MFLFGEARCERTAGDGRVDGDGGVLVLSFVLDGGEGAEELVGDIAMTAARLVATRFCATRQRSLA